MSQLCVLCCVLSGWNDEQRYPNGGCWILRIRKKAGQTNTSVLGKMWQVTDMSNHTSCAKLFFE